MRVLGVQSELAIEFLLRDFFTANLESALQNFVHTDNFKTELKLALRNPCDVEQVIDQARFQFHVPSNDLQGLPDFRRIRCARLQFSDHRDNG